MPPAPRPPQPTSAKVTGGRVHSVKCPWCGKPNDFRGLDAENLIDKGSDFICDHCGHIMECVNFETVKVVTVRQHPTKRHVVPKRPGDR